MNFKTAFSPSSTVKMLYLLENLKMIFRSYTSKNLIHPELFIIYQFLLPNCEGRGGGELH